MKQQQGGVNTWNCEVSALGYGRVVRTVRQWTNRDFWGERVVLKDASSILGRHFIVLGLSWCVCVVLETLSPPIRCWVMDAAGGWEGSLSSLLLLRLILRAVLMLLRCLPPLFCAHAVRLPS